MTRPSTLRAWPRLLAAVLLLAPVSCGSSGGRGGGVTGPPAPPGPISLSLQSIGTFNTPVLVTAPPGDLARVMVVQKDGLVRIRVNGVLRTAPFLDLRGLVSTGGEQGLLGLAFDPAYASSGRFFVSYTDVGGSSVLARYHVSVNPDVAAPAADEILLTVAQPAGNHNGGMIAFGPDGYLYYGLGDGGGSNDQFGNGQSLDDLLGSILRIDVRGPSGYSIPGDNPFAAPARRELWNLGLRNPWRFSFDRVTGDLYIGDVGQDAREEIDVAPAASGGGRGENYGWNVMEGAACFSPPSGCSTAGLTLPVVDYAHVGGNCAVTGGYVYRGTAIPALEGTYFYADYCAHWVRSFRLVGGVATEAATWPSLDPGSAITSFGEDAAGALYLTTEGGGVFKIVSP